MGWRVLDLNQHAQPQACIQGWLDTTYLSEDGSFRISKGNKGTVFVLVREQSPKEVLGKHAAQHPNLSAHIRPACPYLHSLKLCMAGLMTALVLHATVHQGPSPLNALHLGTSLASQKTGARMYGCAGSLGSCGSQGPI